MSSLALNATTSVIDVGFGTAALGGNSYQIVQLALQAGFTKFDTAEADWWYDQKNVGRGLKDYFESSSSSEQQQDCQSLEISTKIPPWSLFSIENIRQQASNSRMELVGFCQSSLEDDDSMLPLDVYYIHAPKCWKGWHNRCTDAPPALPMLELWKGMEAVIQDGSAKRIGLSNVRPEDLIKLIQDVQDRQAQGDSFARVPDVLQAYADPIRPAKELRQICKDHGIEFVSYSTLGTQHRNVAQNPVLNAPAVQQLSAKYGRSVAEIVLSWARQRDMSVIPRSTNPRHISELARLLTDPLILEAEDLELIDAMEEMDLSAFEL